MSDEHSVVSRADRVVAIARWVFLVLVAMVAVWSVWRFALGHDGGAKEASAGRYFCPMHHEVRSNVPGECPICHMTLVLITTTNSADAGAGHDGGATDDATVSRPREVMLTLDQVQRSGVVTESARRVIVVDPVHASAVIEATERSRSELRVRSAGFIERLSARETGSRVTHGEALAWVYSPQCYQVQLELLTALRWSERSPGDGGHLGATVEAARTSLGLLGMSAADIDSVVRTRRVIRAVAVRAPASATVIRRGAVLGMYATPETVLYELTDLTRVWAVASVYERDISEVHPGAAAAFTSAGLSREARVELVEPRVSAETRTVRVRFSLDNRDGALRPGQFGQIDLARSAREGAVSVPRDAVIDTGRERYVFVDRGGGSYQARPVVLGRETFGRWELREGITEGERVVVRGGFLLDSETRLTAALRQTAVDAGAPR